MRPARVVAAVSMLAVLGACGVPGEQEARVLSDADVPFGLLEPRQPVPSDAPVTTVAAVTATVFLVRGDRLAPVSRAAEQGPDALLELLLAGPTVAESETGVRTAIPATDAVRGVTIEDDTAAIDLAPRFAEASASEQRLALAQLTFTFTDQAGVNRVVFTVDGQPTNVPRGDGTATDGPVGRDDYASLAP